MVFYQQKLAAQYAAAQVAEQLADAAIEWLVSRNIIGPEPDAPVYLSDDTGYPPGDDWKRAVVKANASLESSLETTVEPVTERTVSFSRWGEQTCSCPMCGAEQPFQDVTSVIDPWYNGNGNLEYVCNECSECFRLTEAEFDPPWGFADFGLYFSNWPRLSDGFIERLEAHLDQPLIRALIGHP